MALAIDEITQVGKALKTAESGETQEEKPQDVDIWAPTKLGKKGQDKKDKEDGPQLTFEEAMEVKSEFHFFFIKIPVIFLTFSCRISLGFRRSPGWYQT